MREFFYLEGAYLILGGIILLITLYVTTRPFMSEGAVKKGITGVFIVLALMIAGHYWITIKRMKEVKTAFEQDRPIVCESRMQRKMAQSVIVQRSKGWKLKDNNFVSSYYTRPFFIARCIVK